MTKSRGIREVDGSTWRLIANLEALAAACRSDGRRATILEVGCGYGTCLREVRRRWPEFDVVGMNRAKHPGQPACMGFPVVYGDAGSRIPLQSCSVDFAFSYATLPFISDKLGFFAEIHRVLRAGGQLRVKVQKKLWHADAPLCLIALPTRVRHSTVRPCEWPPGGRRGVAGGGLETRAAIQLVHFLTCVGGTTHDVTRRGFRTLVLKKHSDTEAPFVFPSIGPVEVVAPVRKTDGEGADCYEVTSCYRWSARAEAPQFSTAPRKPRYTPYEEYVGGGMVQLHGTMSASTSASASASAHYWDRYLQQRVVLSPGQVASKVSRMLLPSQLPSQPKDVRKKEGGGRMAREGRRKKEDTESTHEAKGTKGAKGVKGTKVVGKRKARDEKKSKEGQP